MLEAIKYNLSREMPNWEWYIVSSSGGIQSIRGTRSISSVLTNVFMIHLVGTCLIATYTNTLVVPNRVRKSRFRDISNGYLSEEFDFDCGVAEGSKTIYTIRCDISNPTFSLENLISEMKRFP